MPNKHNAQTLEEELKALIIRTLELEDISVSDIVSEDPLFDEGLGLDSIDALEIGLMLQKSYGVVIDSDDESTHIHFASIANLASFIQTNQGIRVVETPKDPGVVPLMRSST